MSQPQIDVEQLKQVVTEVTKKIRELKLDVKLSGELKKLADTVEDLRDWLNKYTTFAIRPNYHWLNVEKVGESVGYFVVEGRVAYYTVKLSKKVGETTIIDVYNEFFSDFNVVRDLLGKLVETLENVVKVIRDNYDLVDKLKYIEDRLWELERSDP